MKPEQINGKMYQPVEYTDNCNKCAFNSECNAGLGYFYEHLCTADCRSDRVDVYFVEITDEQ